MHTYFTPFFLPCNNNPGDSLFCVYYPAVQPARTDVAQQNISNKKAVVFIPPFAEEMNKSRHLISSQARSLADAGVSSLIVDLYGTGDSSADFSEARWRIWVDDVRQSIEWLQNKEYSEISCICLRLGGLLALDVAASTAIPIEKIVWWQPVLNGEMHLRQFLRLRSAQGMISSNHSTTENTQELYDRMVAGELLEIGGYDLHPDMGGTMIEKQANSFVASPSCMNLKFDIIELVSSEGKQSSLPSVNLVRQLQAAGHKAKSHAVIGEHFWNAREIHLNQALIQTTTSVLS
ncbi:MAG: hydrolase 2, exosortase A system-associated [Pseudomonadales bacterium]|nr:hydrolase 2, exosortase A system-associated [Pseudomonadales bacterium]